MCGNRERQSGEGEHSMNWKKIALPIIRGALAYVLAELVIARIKGKL